MPHEPCTERAPHPGMPLPLHPYHARPMYGRRWYDSYGKGCCCTWFGCCDVGCNPGYGDDGGCLCVRWADTIWKSTYDRGVGYAKFRTYIKSSYLPDVRTAIKSFAKQTSLRGSIALTCASGKDTDAALCYDTCASGYTGEQKGVDLVGAKRKAWVRPCPALSSLHVRQA